MKCLKGNFTKISNKLFEKDSLEVNSYKVVLDYYIRRNYNQTKNECCITMGRVIRELGLPKTRLTNFKEALDEMIKDGLSVRGYSTKNKLTMDTDLYFKKIEELDKGFMRVQDEVASKVINIAIKEKKDSIKMLHLFLYTIRITNTINGYGYLASSSVKFLMSTPTYLQYRKLLDDNDIFFYFNEMKKDKETMTTIVCNPNTVNESNEIIFEYRSDFEDEIVEELERKGYSYIVKKEDAEEAPTLDDIPCNDTPINDPF